MPRSLKPLSILGAEALHYSQEFGVAVFPVKPREKAPPFTPHGYLCASTHAEQIAEWWQRWPTANVGAVPGSIHCAAIDIDGPEGARLAASLDVHDVATLVTHTARGSHHWFRLPRGMHVGNLGKTELDVRASAGYVLLPPSIHPTGITYTMRGSFDDIAEAPSTLLAWLERAGRAEDDHQREQRERAHQRRTTPPAAGLTTLDRLTEARLLAYTGSMYGLADGRKRAAYRLAAWLVSDLDLAHDVASQFITTWNAFNAPPLADDMLARLCRDAWRRVQREKAA